MTPSLRSAILSQRSTQLFYKRSLKDLGGRAISTPRRKLPQAERNQTKFPMGEFSEWPRSYGFLLSTQKQVAAGETLPRRRRPYINNMRRGKGRRVIAIVPCGDKGTTPSCGHPSKEGNKDMERQQNFCKNKKILFYLQPIAKEESFCYNAKSA